MLDAIEMNERFHLVHATHLTSDETKGIANSKANVVLCPSTEGNLGDGIFPLREFQSYGGKWSIGTDSHIGLNPLEELRILDYGQRLISHKRNTFISEKTGNSGEFAIEMSTTTGRKAMNNFNVNYFSVGNVLNAFIVKKNSPLLASCSSENLASTIVYASDSSQIEGTISNGEYLTNGRCKDYDQIQADFVATLNELKNRL